MFSFSDETAPLKVLETPHSIRNRGDHGALDRLAYDNLKSAEIKLKFSLIPQGRIPTMTTLENTRHCSFTARLDCRYLVHAPEAIDDRTVLAATLHGFSANPEVMLRLTAGMLGPRHVIAAVQGPNQFYLSQGSNEVGYGWATHKHPDSSVRLHHDMLLHVLNETGREYGIPASRRILAGFSQPVGMNYRFAATHPSEIRGVIGICGGIPRNWEEGPYHPVTASVLHIARREDEFYKPEVTERYAERLRVRAADVEFHMLDGGHRFPSKAKPIADAWLARITGQVD
jgi:predicted esterase